MSGPESKIEYYLKKRVVASGGRVRKLRWIGQRGAPDRFIWWPEEQKGMGPIACLVEVKAPGKKATAQQLREHARLRADGFSVVVAASVEEVDAMIENMMGMRTTESVH